MLLLTPCTASARVAFTATIQGLKNNSCARLREPPPPLTDICAFVGETVKFQCVRDGGDPNATTPMIRTPGEMVIQGTSTLTVTTNANGTFECFSRSRNETKTELHVQVYGKQNVQCTSNSFTPVLHHTLLRCSCHRHYGANSS